MKIKTISVSALNKYLAKIVRGNGIFSNLVVEGEMSNIRISKSGYCYFTLSDASSSINCIKFDLLEGLNNGDKVIVYGRLNVYEAKGTCQIVIDKVEKIGLGNILNEIKILREKLKNEGAFDNKKDIPIFPGRIGIITSQTGAALQDVLQTFRYYGIKLDITVYDSLVQGEAAKLNVIKGIEFFNSCDEVDFILITRGGGSFEDLDVFNDVNIAKSIMLSKIPVITGIGHETDITISDYVADKSLHTPTAAATYICQRQANFISDLEQLKEKIRILTENYVNNLKSEVIDYYSELLKLKPSSKYEQKRIEILQLKDRLSQAINLGIEKKHVEISSYYQLLITHNVDKVLKNGFAITLSDERKIITDESFKKNLLNVNDEITIIYNNYEIKANIKDISKKNP